MTDEKPKTKVLGGAGNPKKIIELRNKEGSNGITVADGAYNPNKIIEIRNDSTKTTIATHDPSTGKITVRSKELK